MPLVYHQCPCSGWIRMLVESPPAGAQHPHIISADHPNRRGRPLGRGRSRHGRSLPRDPCAFSRVAAGYFACCPFALPVKIPVGLRDQIGPGTLRGAGEPATILTSGDRLGERGRDAKTFGHAPCGPPRRNASRSGYDERASGRLSLGPRVGAEWVGPCGRNQRTRGFCVVGERVLISIPRG